MSLDLGILFLPVGPFISASCTVLCSSPQVCKGCCLQLGLTPDPSNRASSRLSPSVLCTVEPLPINSLVTRARANRVADTLWAYPRALSVSYSTWALSGVRPPCCALLCVQGPGWSSAAVWLPDQAEYRPSHAHRPLWALGVWGWVLSGGLDSLSQSLPLGIVCWEIQLLLFWVVLCSPIILFQIWNFRVHKSRHDRTGPSLSGMVHNDQLMAELVLLQSMHLPFPIF